MLEVDKIGIYHDFFKLGGHSLSAVRVEVELEKQGIHMDNTDIYVYRTIESLAQHIRKRRSGGENE